MAKVEVQVNKRSFASGGVLADRAVEVDIGGRTMCFGSKV
jgi:hypothetical protein